MENTPRLNLVIDVLMLAGAILAQSGAEIHRVEDTMIRIAHSQGIEQANVLAIPAAIFFSIDHTNISRMKRIVSSNYDMQKVCDVNQVSRSLGNEEISLEEAWQQLNRIKQQKPPYNNIQVTLAAVIAASRSSLRLISPGISRSGSFFSRSSAAVARLSRPSICPFSSASALTMRS